MSCQQISTVITALRPLQADFAELTSEINNLWSQLLSVQKTNFPNREHISTIIRLNLTDSIEKFQTLLVTLSTHISSLDVVLSLKKPLRLSNTFNADLEFLLNHLKDVHNAYQRQLSDLTDCLDPIELEKPLDDRNLFEESYQLSRIIRRIRADLSLKL